MNQEFKLLVQEASNRSTTLERRMEIRKRLTELRKMQRMEREQVVSSSQKIIFIVLRTNVLR